MTAPSVCFFRVGKCRLEIFRKACRKFGLTVLEQHSEHALTLIDDELDVLSACQALRGSALTLVRTQWLSDSIKKNELLSHQSYVLRARPALVEPTPPPAKRERSLSASDTDEEPAAKKVKSPRDRSWQSFVLSLADDGRSTHSTG